MARTVDAGVELLLPVPLSTPQLAAYHSVLARQYEALSDTRPPRHWGHWVALLRQLSRDLCKVRVCGAEWASGLLSCVRSPNLGVVSNGLSGVTVLMSVRAKDLRRT